MAAFNLTAQINLRGPTNLKPIVSQIRRELGTVNTEISLKIDNKAIKSIDSATNRLNAMNKVLTQVRSNTASLNQSLRDLSGSLGTVQSASSGAATSVRKTSDSVEKVAKNVQVARTEMEEFGRQSALAIRRFAAFTVVTTGIFALTNAITGAFKAFISFDKELVRLQQVTGRGAIGIKILQDEITNLSTSLGVSSEALTQVSTTLAQAGFNIEQTRIALKALAKTELAPSFENLTKTTEGAIAAIRQFGLEAGELESALGSINAVAAAFAVESGDIIAAIQRTGGVFASASKGVSEGTDALNEFISIFTSVRATTRESAETIATGLRTIFTRIQRGSTIKQLKEFGVELQDLEGKFVGPFEAVRRLSEALNQLDPRDIRFSTIVEELGGFRQIGKVIPLIQQFATAQQALGVAQRGQSSLTDAQIKAQQSLANQIAKVREQFLALIRDVGQSTVFQGFFKIITSLASGLISLASAFKPILPILAVFGAIKGVSAIGQFATGFFGGLKKGGGAGGTGQNIGESLSGAKEKARAEATTKAADAIRLNTDALNSLTSAVQSLDSTIKSRGAATLNQGGKVLGFNKGGIVPGSGRGDRVPAMLEPGEVVMNRKAVNKYGAGNLVRMNRYADGGKIEVTAKELKNRSRGSVAVKELITDQADRQFYTQGKAINTNDNISFTRRLYKLNAPNLVNDSAGFEKAVAEKVGGQLTSEGRNDPNYPIDITNSNFGPLEVRNRRSPTSKRTLLDKLIRYYIKNNQRVQRLSNSPEVDDIKLGQIGLVYNSAKYDPPNAKELKLGGMIQKFESGSPGGVRLSSGKGRGKTGARGARSKYDFFGIEEYQKWSKPIYDEYYADPSLTWSSFSGIPMPPEIALYHKMVEEEVFSRGGAGLAVGKKFVRTPSENITDELRPYLEVDPSDPSQLGFYKEVIAKFAKQKAASASQTAKLGKGSALKAREDQFAAYTNAENAISEFKKTGMLSLDPGIMSYIKKSITNPDSLPLDSDDIQGIKKKLTKPNLDAFFALTGPESLPVGVQGQRTKLAEVFNSILDTYGSDTSDLEIDNIIGGVGSKLMNKSLGGLISNFMAGSVGGVGSSVGKISEDILERIKALGGKGGLVNLAPEAVSNAVRATGVSANQLLKTPVLKAMPNGAKFAPELEKLLEIAEKVQSDKVKKAQKQLEDNMKAASGGAYQFGLVSLYGPNGELGYSDTSDARELLGGDGNTKYLTQIVRKSLPQRYAEALASIQQDIAGLPARGAEAFQYTDIFGAGGPLAFDFDETLVKDADIFAPNGGIDIQGYNDLEKVKKALADSKLTLLGKELAKRLIDYPELMDNIRVLTARPQSNAPLLASKLASLGLPIPEDKITGVSGGLNKVENLSELETLIDDNLGNIQSVTAGGKKAYLYREPQGIDPNNQSSQKARASIEGYNLEEIVRNLGVGISADDADPNRPIDYPKGLGAGASIWDIKPTLPTDTKRTNDSSALSRMWAEAERYMVENFAVGGIAKAPKQTFGTGEFPFPKRISNAYFKEIDKVLEAQKIKDVWDINPKDERIIPDEQAIQAEYNAPFDKGMFLTTFKDRISKNNLFQRIGQFAKFIGLPQEDLSAVLPQQIDFGAPGMLGGALFSADPTGFKTRGLQKIDLSQYGFSEQDKQDVFGYGKLLEEKQKAVKKVLKTPIQTFEDGSFQYDSVAAQSLWAEIDDLKTKISAKAKIQRDASDKAKAARMKIAEATGRGGVSIDSDSFSGATQKYDVLYHELTHQLFQSMRTRKSESFDKYKNRVSSLFETDNDGLAEAFDSLDQYGYKSADVVYGRSYKQKTLESIVLSIYRKASESRSKEDKDFAVDMSKGITSSQKATSAKAFKPINPNINDLLLRGNVDQKSIDKMEDNGKEEFLTTLVQNAPKLDDNLAGILDNILANLLGDAGIARQKFAAGGLAEATGAMSSLMSGLYGNRSQQTSKPNKNFGRIALRTGNRIQATYIKEGEAAEARSGQVIADKINSSLYAVQSSAATKGYGPKLYDIVMEAATAEGAMLTSDRRTVSDAAKSVWAYYFKNRSDVNKTPLDPENWVSNSRLLDEKLYGPPETWPPPTDPAWILQTGYSKSASDINNSDLVQKLARGGSSGTVPAMVSNGEAYVPPNVAKKIGYAKLDRMNQADKNGMGRYASGGSISTFKGPGSGTSDSIGPIGLPTGSYVIREKATKALGLNKGGSVGIKGFANGGRLSKEERKRLKEQFLAEQRGGVTREEARAVGVPRPDFGTGASRKRDVMATPEGAANVAKIEAQVLSNYNKLYKQQEQNIDKFYDDLSSQAQNDFFDGKISADELTEILSDLFDSRILKKTQAKQQLTTQAAAATEKAVQDYTQGRQASRVEERKAVDIAAFDTEVKSGMDAIVKEAKSKYEALYSEEKQRLKDYYQAKAKNVADEGGDVLAVIEEYRAAVGELKQSVQSGFKTEVQQKQAEIPEQVATQKAAQLEQIREDKARTADPFYDAKKAAEASTAGVPGMPKVNEQIRQEQSDYLRFKAEKAGMSVGGYKYSMAQKVGQAQFDVERETTLARTETKSIAAGRRRELQGINIKESLQADTQEGRRVQSIIDEFAGNLQKADPSLGAGAAREAAIALAEGLSEGTKSVAEIVAGNETLKNTLEGNIDSTKILDEAFRRTALEMGESVENLKANVSSKQVQQQAFIKSTEGQRFGQLAQFAPGLTERFSKTGLGKGLGVGADFISGKGGRLSKAFAGAGGFTGIGAGLSVGAEALKQALPKSVTSDPNTAGALGALGGAGTGAAAGAQIGSIAGPIGSLVGGIGGAIIGGIQGFFNAKNQAILTNAIENVAKTTGELDIAFKKLETNASAVNLDNAQKAFGQVLGAQQDIRQMAFTAPSLTGTDAATIGGTALAGAATGAAIGALVGSVVPVLGTAIGAAVGGAIGGIGTAAYSFFNRPSKAQRAEALGATIQQSGANQEAATRLAENQLKFTATEDIDKAFKDSNPIVEQYKKGLLESAKAQGITNEKQLENISAQAEEQAALDAFMKLRKEAGATDEQIGKELEKNRKEAIATGKQSLEANAELLRKQTLLARATKEVAVATESLLDVYRRIGAEADKYGNNLQRFSTELDAILADIGGKGTIRNVDRKNEEILANVSAFSIDEVRAAAGATAGFLGNTPEAQNLANQAVGQKLVQDQIPALLRAAKGGDPKTKDLALDQVKALLASQGLEGAAIDTIVNDLETKLAEGQGLTEGELANEIQKSFSTVGKGLEALQKVQKQYNDTLQQARNLQNQYNKTLSEAQAFFVKATQVRLNAEIDLAKALGRSPTLQQLNEPFDLEISSLTSGLVQSGALAAGAAGDPMAILAAMQANQQRISSLEETGKELGAAGANIPAGAAGDPLRQKLNSEQLKNIESIASLTEASAQGRKALEKLANDGTKAANALSKIQEQQQAVEGFANFAQQVFTAEPQQLAQMEIQATALNAALESGPEFMQSRFNRQQAFAGLEQAKQFLTPQEFKDTQADLLRKSFESQGFAGGDVVKEIGGKQFTLDEFIERVRGGGPDETDPNVIAFREATEVQAKANEALGLTLETEATKISEAMATLEDFLSNQFPDILAQAVTKSREDATTKPEVKAAEKPQERSFAETRVTQAKEMQQQGRDKLEELKKEEEGLSWWQRDSETVGRINQERRKAQQQIAGGKELEERFQPQAERDKVFREAQTSFDRSKQALDEARVKGEEMQAKKAQAEQTIEKARESRGGDRPVMVDGAGRRVAPTVAAAGMPVQPVQIPAVDITAQALRQEEIKARTEKVSQLGGIKTAKQEEIAEKEKETAKRENRLKTARRAAIAAGTLKDQSGEIVNPNVLAAQEAVDSSKKLVDLAKQDLSSINEQITAEKQRLAALAEQAKLEAQGTQPQTGAANVVGQVTPEQRSAVVNAFAGTPSFKGGYVSDEDKARAANFPTTIPTPPIAASSDAAKTTDTEVKSATEGVQTSVAQLQSPLDLVAQMATAALQSGSIYTHDTNLSEMLGLLNETMANFAAIPTSDPGFIVSDLKVLEALNNLQEPFAALEQMAIASLSEGINTKDATLSAVASTFTPAISQVSAAVSTLLTPIESITSILSPILDSIASPIKAIAGYFGVQMSTNQALGAARGLVTAGPVGALAGYAGGTAIDAITAKKTEVATSQSITPNRLELASANSSNRVISGPVQSTTAQQSPITASQPTPQSAQDARLISIDPDSIEKLNTFNTNFATYVDKLVTFEFPTIPDVIEMKGNHVVDVRISGAAAFEGLKKDFENMMQKEIKKAMGKIWGQSGGQMGDRPDGNT